jgi:hypothetical protein
MTLDELIRTVETDAPSADPLDHLATAMSVKADVDELTDSLIGHYVDRARRARLSWSQIGGAMGVSKQAAQQRHAEPEPGTDEERLKPWKLGRFTARARRAVRQAQREARDLGHGWLGTEHLLLGVLHDPDALATIVLAELGVTRDDVVRAIVDSPFEPGRPRRHLPFTPLAKAALDRTLVEALELGHNYIGTEHIVLALHHVEEGVARKVLRGKGVERDALRRAIVQRLVAG